MDIRVLIPVELTDEWFDKAVNRYGKWSLPETACRGYDPSHLESPLSDDWGKLMVRMASRAESEGADGCLLDCFTDPGLRECRQTVGIPVFGVGEQGMFFARTMSQEFGMITSDDSALEEITENAGNYGLGDNLSRAGSISIQATEIPDRLGETKGRLLDEALKMPEKISTIVLGCTELAELAPFLSSELSDRGRDVFVINPIMVAVRQLESRLLM